jgi:hypothetical protein
MQTIFEPAVQHLNIRTLKLVHIWVITLKPFPGLSLKFVFCARVELETNNFRRHKQGEYTLFIFASIDEIWERQREKLLQRSRWKWCENWETNCWAGRKSIILLESSQTSPSRPSDKGSVKVELIYVLLKSHIKQIVLPLQGRISQSCLGKWSLFVLRITKKNT